VKPKVILATTLFALLLGGLCVLSLHRRASLPRIRLADGGEFRVLKICYGRENDHHLGGAPSSFFSAWNHLPKQLQRVIPYPNTGVTSLSPFPESPPALSIWWAYIDPRTHKPEIGSTDYVITTLDSGERLGRIWPSPGDDYRQIFLNDPPAHSKYLRFEFAAEEQAVEFSIANPAYKDSHAQARNGSGVLRKPPYFRPVEITVFSGGYGQGGGGLEVHLPESISVQKNVEELEFEYAIINLFSADVFVAVEPKDDVADSFPAFHDGGMHEPSLKRYALVPRAKQADGKRVTYSASRKALMLLRNPLESGGRFHLCIYIEGCFRDTGQPFYGSTYIDLPVTIAD
jgi:hypothetical protein